ncbi:MAG: HAD family hydrolase [Pleurocapsa sp. CRU_1_2]|nr:HAD family hydrolase [Pleurocapsa sp. CRU_1_2]
MTDLNKLPSTAAFFDVDGTLAKVNAVTHYQNLANWDCLPFNRWWLSLQLAVKVPYYISLDRFDRQLFNQVFYKNYRNWSVIQLQERSQAYFEEKLRSQLFPTAKDCIAHHKKQGQQVILVTGSLDFIVAPLAEFLGVDAILATRLQTQNGHYTGEIAGISPTGENKVNAIQSLSLKLGIDLSQSFAYGDSASDLPMLMKVGHPVAVNPDRILRQFAQRQRWTIEYWKLK